MQVVQSNPNVQDLRSLLVREHAQLETAFETLLAAFNADARTEFAQLWSEFDARLRAHMLLEETSMLPAFARKHSHEAERILAEHQEIRKTLTDLAIGIDLHQVRADLVEKFIALLRSHAAREDELFYTVAQDRLGLAERSSLLERLLARLQHAPEADAPRMSR